LKPSVEILGGRARRHLVKEFAPRCKASPSA
jgi:hypothetical protein